MGLLWMPNGEQITRHVAKIPRREFTTSLLHPLAIIVKQPRTADTAWRSTFLENRLFTEFAWTDLPLWIMRLVMFCMQACPLDSAPPPRAPSVRRCCFHTKSKVLSKEGNHTKNYWFVNEKGGRQRAGGHCLVTLLGRWELVHSFACSSKALIPSHRASPYFCAACL